MILQNIKSVLKEKRDSIIKGRLKNKNRLKEICMTLKK